MITARIETQVRTIEVKCEDNKDKAISALQESVKQLTKEDGRCKFVVLDCYSEVYSWYYQPTFREEKPKKQQVKKEPKYEVDICIYTILRGYELSYDNLFRDGECFNSVAEAREYMKEEGYDSFDYKVVYEYIVSPANGNSIYGTGLGFTKSEAIESLNQNLSYYELEYKNSRIREI